MKTLKENREKLVKIIVDYNQRVLTFRETVFALESLIKENYVEKEFAQYCAEQLFEDFEQSIDGLGFTHYECLNDGEDYSFNELYAYWKENIKQQIK